MDPNLVDRAQLRGVIYPVAPPAATNLSPAAG